MSYVAWDVETTTRTSYKRKGNPFDPLNNVVASGFKRFGDKGVTIRWLPEDTPKGWLKEKLAPINGKPVKMLVGFNIKFDLLHALQDEENLEAWMEFVAGGGTVWDGQLAEYLLDGMVNASHMLSLNEVAPRYGGTLKIDAIKELWDAGVDTRDIDPDLLAEYLTDDVTNTELIFRGQLERAKASGQIKSIMLNMGSLLCTIEMERNGMAVDVAEGRRQAAVLKAELDELTERLNQYLPKDLPFEFNWGSRNQKSALIFGGNVKYEQWVQHTDDAGNLLYAKKKVKAYYLTNGDLMPVEEWERLDRIGWDVTCNPPPEREVYASGRNKGEYKTKMVDVPDLTKPKGAKQDFLYRFPRITEPKKEWETSAPGVYSVSSEVIEKLGNRDIPFLKDLSRQEALAKDLGTYYITTDKKGEEKGMLTLVQPDGLIHHSLNHTSTVTGRFSSSNPNLQNIPKEGKSVVKTVFVSRFGEDGKIIQSDFTALEVYVQAVLTGSKQLIADLKAGLDMHVVRVSQKEGVEYEYALKLCKDDKGAGTKADPVWAKKRSNAKVFSFQRAYGAGAALISEDTGMPLEEVEALIVAENERYPEIEQYYSRITEEIKANSVQGIFVQHPSFPGLTCNLRSSYYFTPDGKKYSYVQKPAPDFLAKKGTLSSFSPTEIKNYVVQGSGGEWAKAAMHLAIRAFYARKNFGGLALLVNQVHDALYADAAAEVAQEAAALLHACMEAASEYIEYLFDWPVPVPVPSDTTLGANMMEEGLPDRGFAERCAVLRQEIRDTYMEGYVPTFERK